MPARLALPILALLVTAAAPAEQRVDVALSNFAFTPATITLVRGRPYVLHLSSKGGHSFAAKAFFAAATIAPADRARIKDGRVELADGASIDIHLSVPGAGIWPIKCTHFLHAGLGMTGKVVVR